MRQTYGVQSKFTTIVCTETSFIEANNVAEPLETIRIGNNPVNPIRDVLLHLAGQKFSLIFLYLI